MNKILRNINLRYYFAIIWIAFCLSHSYAQKITFSGQNIPLEKALEAIRKQTDYTVFGNKAEIQQAKKISIEADNMELKNFLAAIFANEPFQYNIENKVISLSKILQQPKTNSPSKTGTQQRSIIGTVVRKDNEKPIPNATIRIKGTSYQAKSNPNGDFALIFPSMDENPTVEIKILGMKPFEVQLDLSINPLLVARMEEAQQEIDDVVVTGIFNRKKDSFSGAYATYTAEQLQMASASNVLEGLQILDPSFQIVQNNSLGSDPNQQLNLEIRGKTSVAALDDAFGTDPNQPLFILDGFESTMERIRNIPIDRLASITILKDATATALYGSKGANGIIVVESKKPKSGELIFNYSGRMDVEIADLTDYNLMNAAEKLQFELLSGHYGRVNENGQITNNNNLEREQVYLDRLKEVKRGVDSYWLNEPIRTGIGQSHNFSLDGGDQSFQYSIGLNRQVVQGAMKKSGKEVTDGNISLIYRKGKFSFNNVLNARYVVANKEPVSFLSFAQANPYYRKYNEEGEPDKYLENISNDVRFNPLYDFNNNNLSKTDGQEIINNLSVEWNILRGLHLRVNAGLSQFRNSGEIFRSPNNSEYATSPMRERGKYTESKEKSLNYNGRATLSYGNTWNKHTVNIGSSMSLFHTQRNNSQYSVQGFIDDKIINPQLALTYELGILPSYQDLRNRSMAVLMNTNYGYDGRFLVDANLSVDGSSLYGSNRNFTNIYSIGGAWNLHREAFLKDVDWIDQLRLRASYGNQGNQNFKAYIAMQIYQYNTLNANPFGSGLSISNFGNPDLKWQRTYTQNYSVDFKAFNDRLRIMVDYFLKDTNPLLVSVTTASSNGRDVSIQNLGGLMTKGVEGILSVAPILKPQLTWRLDLNLSHSRSEYQDIGNKLDNHNQKNRNRSMIRFYDGGSPDDLWAVPSLGIDPSTGREIFLNRFGEETFVFNYQDEVKIGNSRALFDGNLTSTFFYKNFNLMVSFGYQLGGKTFMNTLYNKVENISSASLRHNQDKRALYDRWQQPGDEASFKALSLQSSTPMSSRFIQDNDVLTLDVVSLSYRTSTWSWLKQIRARSMNFGVGSNRLMHLSTIRNERGIDYPFARHINFSCGISF
ncbi:TonB-linked outer membrane protein, SusC/RagA family [Sphingobacterium nematocida]|uniref:TonB-linked outer membrane protein, SusC/RagA family n=1 Tax=Sphingobacterium nematocida TaxID=1513896 RepID=A0A1T5ATI7_9SPHI|nr:SusC/RagA family TonB-linked outer membrane protein [Sphingobacterium nematocida]SKB38351.1 TonB-linked outer membrane protein, SusC/RagA family [Sphingobacterium nematocida]